MKVYLNGAFIDAAQATVSLEDRGFLFADGVYEVWLAYAGNLFLGEAHVARMRAGLAALQIDTTPAEQLLGVARRLLELNQLAGRDAIFYAQVTRGAAPRQHAFPPAGTPPTVYLNVRPLAPRPEHFFTDGCAAITVPDNRWSRCDIKSIALLPNVLANQAAHAAGAFEALFVKDGVVIEGSHSNLVAVVDGELVTYPTCNYILPGITRSCVLDLARTLGISVREGPIYHARLDDVAELFLTGTTTEVMPVTRVDARPIGDGRPGPFTRRLLEAYRGLR